MVSIKEIESFKDYGRCICVTNGVIEAYVTVDIGAENNPFRLCGRAEHDVLKPQGIRS